MTTSGRFAERGMAATIPAFRDDTLTLTRFKRIENYEPTPDEPPFLGMYVDCETTGLDPEVDEIIELAIEPFMFTASGRVVCTTDALAWREQPSKPIPPVDGPAPLRVGRTNHRRVTAAAGTKKPEMRRVLGFIRAAATAAGRHRGRIVPVFLPQDFSRLHLECVEVVGDPGDVADLLRPRRGVQLADHEHGHERMECPHRVVGLQLPQELEVLDVRFGEGLLVSVPAGALIVAAVGRPVVKRGAAGLRADGGDRGPSARAPRQPAAHGHCRETSSFFHH